MYIAKGIQALSRRYGDAEGVGGGANELDELQAGQCFHIWEFEGSVFSQQVAHAHQSYTLLRHIPPPSLYTILKRRFLEALTRAHPEHS
jgi:hypothetical protein